MIIRAKHTCESDLRAFCTKCIWSISCTSSPRQNLIPILFYSFHLSLHCACLKTLFWLFWGNMFCKFAPSWQTGPHAGRSGASTYYFPCFWSTKQYLMFPIFVILLLERSQYKALVGENLDWHTSVWRGWIHSTLQKARNGPEGWVQLTKETCLGHITSWRTNLENSTSESRPSINFKITIKHSASWLNFKYWPNLASDSRPRFNFIASTKH